MVAGLFCVKKKSKKNLPTTDHQAKSLKKQGFLPYPVLLIADFGRLS